MIAVQPVSAQVKGSTPVPPTASARTARIYERAQEADHYHKDHRAAAVLYQQACDLGEPKACSDLGYLYDNSLGVKHDPQRAADSTGRDVIAAMLSVAEIWESITCRERVSHATPGWRQDSPKRHAKGEMLWAAPISALSTTKETAFLTIRKRRSDFSAKDVTGEVLRAAETSALHTNRGTALRGVYFPLGIFTKGLVRSAINIPATT
jgi:hypothetical protein